MSYYGRHLGFYTLKMFRKNATLIFLKAYNVFFRNQVSFCFYQKIYTELQMSIHYISNIVYSSRIQHIVSHIPTRRLDSLQSTSLRLADTRVALTGAQHISLPSSLTKASVCTLGKLRGPAKG